MALLNAKRFTYVVAAVEAARRYAAEHPDSAARIIDRVFAFVDSRTHRRWARLLDDASALVKRGIIGHDVTTDVRPPVVATPTTGPD